MEYAWGKFRVTVGLTNSRCTFLSFTAPKSLLPNEAAALLSLGVRRAPNPYRGHSARSEWAEWTSFRGTQVLEHRGNGYDLTYRRGTGISAVVTIIDVALPPKPRWLSDSQAQRLMK